MRRRKYIQSVLLLSFGTLLMIGCGRSSRFKINVNEERVPVEIVRFDKEMLSLDVDDISNGVKKLYEKYPDFFPAYIEGVMEAHPADTALVTILIEEFLTDTDFIPLYNEVLAQFDGADDIESAVSSAYTYINHYFPEIKLPEVYFFVSGLNLSFFNMNSFVGVGSDFYLGSDFSYYQEFMYQYIINSRNRENLVPDIVSALLFMHFRPDGQQQRLLDDMLYRGKVMYLLSVFLPDVKEQYLMGYTKEQIDWCHRYERQAWATILDKKDLFSTDGFLIRKYMNDAPFTSTVSPESPGRLGAWVGMRIVQSYMENNKNISLRDLMETTDYDNLLRESGYRP